MTSSLPRKCSTTELGGRFAAGFAFGVQVKRETARAGDRIRTGDVQLGRLTLYQLSYTRGQSAFFLNSMLGRWFGVLSDLVEWRVMDSNHRRQCRQIYSLLPLATRATLRKASTSLFV